MYTEKKGNEAVGMADSGSRMTGKGMVVLLHLLKVMCDITEEADRLKNLVNTLTPYGNQLRVLQTTILSGELTEAESIDRLESLVAKFSPLGSVGFIEEINGAEGFPPSEVFLSEHITHVFLDLVEIVLGYEVAQELVY